MPFEGAVGEELEAVVVEGCVIETVFVIGS